MENGHILDCFYLPGNFPPRPAQVQVLDEIEKAIHEGKKFIIIQAPTGVGKSAISYALLRYFEEGYVCTGTKALQEQYLSEYESLLSVKGRGNFECLERSGTGTCDKGNCQVLKSKCDRKPSLKISNYPAYFSVRDDCTKYWNGKNGEPVRCYYWVDKVNALNNFAVVHNYKYILTEANYVGEFTKKNVLISDEGHNVEAMIIDFIKVPISIEILDIINKYSEKKEHFIQTGITKTNFEKLRIHAGWLIGLNNTIPIAIEKINLIIGETIEEKIELERQLKSIIVNSADAEEKKRDIEEAINGRYGRLEDLKNDLTRIENLQNHQIAFFLNDISTNLTNWVVAEYYLMNGGIQKIEFQPIKIDKYTYDKYLRLGDINIIMSATILDYTRIASDLGLSLKDVAYIEIDPPFPAKNHQIFNLGVANFGYSKDDTPADMEQFYKDVVEKIDMILELFPEDKGIIHCTTYEFSYAIKKYSTYQDRLIFHNNKNRADKLEEHKSNDIGSVLVSPSMTEGVDLKDDLSRFQILIKVPYPDLSDERIKKRKAVDPPSYKFKTANTIIQAIGRSVRSEKDHAVTFTLDSRFRGFSIQNLQMMKLFTRCVVNNSELRNLEGVKNKSPEFLERLLKPIHRASKGKNECKDRIKMPKK